MELKGLCEHCGKRRTYNTSYIDDYTICKWCGKSGNIKEVKE